MSVYFIGAGPGDPELITIKAQRLIQQCPVILYAGSLVPVEILREVRTDATVIDTAPLNLDEIIDLIENAHQRGHDVARVHSGDPSIYGAIGEQIRRLQGMKIPYEIVPGVTSTSASAAALGNELTLSGVSQTVILTRYAGKTPMPEQESLSELARHRATLAIHLGITRIHKIVDELLPHYGQDCPVAVCYRTGWPEQQLIRGTLADIVAKVRNAGISRTALILVGNVLNPHQFDDSWLYSEQQAHVYRPKVKPATPRQVKRDATTNSLNTDTTNTTTTGPTGSTPSSLPTDTQ
ncbi:precorrin-4 C(11)-methyltransferase [Aestuariirhabdus sp. Z084]|uniref:precorrin-4 C(11)-methyltransferase n=1 Tax=Aestuariirhabdus haliotis TaxID=2918751 RepID=UPI00201B3D74|nr:precorrin-4 C(11)-methyltransferase [Aestuariirhabdus haliotis]MCL6417088.1 precorrin-4 C(11)-methyltransferase [Aestuariirhabdus haliotis]MCL6420622.1 precorrin-4 C(11)-methyltransferase [Aestuariirhabdus haliotis]